MLQIRGLVVSLILGLAAVGKAAMGALGDRIGGKNALGIGLIMIAVGIVILLSARQTSMLILWLIVVGIAGASPVALVPMVIAERLGLKRFGSIFGWLSLTVTLGLFAGPIVVGMITDITGSYTVAFLLCSVIGVVGAIGSFSCVAPEAVKVGLIVEPRPSRV